ncbi:very short patch repair endonuclease [Xanthomonas translucens]|uniref:very short patch repair endonuclease n=1 Tax=Xanthomonas campestris pv. translucens TaxID=343 RepID=UPI0009BD8C7F|nr:DNA mismatch endonuclease Vsr [Xanthomonas translucens]QSQ52108.1 DNA mismatch endonuclease Vsr [Xanthomonas translucens pv. undulosa]QSQ58974.1 DNA mismatch endonuclease Vsr [Xanthomonas translucens pv. undulosa]UPU49870.1 DNA mismatch endonuclease Vsr [Xanthomonas translucens pv. undulosa]
MVDVLTPAQRRFNMSRIRGRDTKPEMIIRRALHACGFRYRLQDRALPGRPDLVFPRHRAVIFVNGCFWHGHDCSLFKLPGTRREFWKSKIASNRTRDERAAAALLEQGWRIAIVWECSLKGTGKLSEHEIINACQTFLLSSEVEKIIIQGTNKVTGTTL